MTNPNKNRPSTNRPSNVLSIHRRLSGLALSGLVIFASILAVGAPMSLLAGCEKKKPPPVVEAPPPPPPPIPDPVQVDPIMQAMSPSAKVQFPQTAAPHSEGLAKGVIAFADALAKGDAEKFGAQLHPKDKPLLAQLEGDGSWEDTTKKLEAVRIVLVEDQVDPNAVVAAVYFAVQGPEGAYVLGWSAIKVGDQWTFSGAAASNATKRRASEWDDAGIAGLASDVQLDIEVPALPEVPDAAPGAPTGG